MPRRRFFPCAAGAAAAACLGLSRIAPAQEVKLALRIDEAPSTHPLIPALKAANESLTALQSVSDYECSLLKNELIGDRMIASKLFLKLREQPFSVYTKFIAPHEGREVIYVAGRNDGKLLVHETGIGSLIGAISLDPAGPIALEENRFPVTMIGMRLLIESVMQTWLRETKLDQVSVNFYPNARIGEISCQAIESSHARRREGVGYQMSRLYIDKKSQFPIRLQNYAFPSRPGEMPRLVEDYTYLEIRTNIGMTDLDFDPANPGYNF